MKMDSQQDFVNDMYMNMDSKRDFVNDMQRTPENGNALNGEVKPGQVRGRTLLFFMNI